LSNCCVHRHLFGLGQVRGYGIWKEEGTKEEGKRRIEETEFGEIKLE
jgi:hypothetical protein